MFQTAKKSHLWNYLSERDLPYIFINGRISASQGNFQTKSNLHISWPSGLPKYIKPLWKTLYTRKYGICCPFLEKSFIGKWYGLMLRYLFVSGIQCVFQEICKRRSLEFTKMMNWFFHMVNAQQLERLQAKLFLWVPVMDI